MVFFLVILVILLAIYFFIERLQLKKENKRLLASAIAIADRGSESSSELYEIKYDIKIVAEDVFRLEIELVDIDSKLVNTDLFVSLKRRLNKYIK